MVIVAKTTVIDEVNAFLKSLYLSRTGYPGHYKYRYYEPDGISHGENGGENKKMNTTVKHDGEYVLTSNGSKDFGEITPEISKLIGRQAGKIRLRIGYHNDNDDKENYGEIHIEREGRLKQLQNAGFENARDFVDYVGKNYNAIYHGGGRSLKISARGNRDYTLFIQLEPSIDGDFYDVKTAMVSRKSYLEKETPLWTKP